MTSLTSLPTALPIPEAPVSFISPPFQVRELGAGRRIVSSRCAASPLLYLQMACPVGASQDPPNREGLASLAAPLFLQGAADWDGPGIARRLAPWGGSLHADATWDFTWVGVTVLREGLEAALRALLASVLRPGFPPATVTRWKMRRLAELERDSASPAKLADSLLKRLLFASSAHGRHLLGNPLGLESILREDLQAFHRRSFLAPGLVLTAVGTFDEDTLLRTIEEALAPWPAAGSEGRELPDGSSLLPDSSVGQAMILDIPHAPQTELRFGCRTVPLDHRDLLGLQLLSSRLGQGFSSRLSQSLREDRGLAYSVFSRIEARRGPSPWLIGSSVDGARAGEALAVMWDEIERLRREPLSNQELGAAKDYLIGLAQTSLKSGRALAGFLQHLVIHGLESQVRERYESGIRDLTPGRLQDLAQEHLAPSRLHAAAVGPAQSLRASMERLFPSGALRELSEFDSSRAEYQFGGVATHSTNGRR